MVRKSMGGGGVLCASMSSPKMWHLNLALPLVPWQGGGYMEGVGGGGVWRFVEISLDRAESGPSRISVSMGMRRGDGPGRGRSYKPF
jgi:hypothetical protein